MLATWLYRGTAYEVERLYALCPKCGALGAIVALPPPLAAEQPDGTTHVCLPPLGGCNWGFAAEVPPTGAVRPSSRD